MTSPRLLAAFDEHADRSPLLVLDLDVVAERYEELAEEAEALHEAGVHLAQGYFFGRPAEPWVAAA